jgi:hypothetical protein
MDPVRQGTTFSRAVKRQNKFLALAPEKCTVRVGGQPPVIPQSRPEN